MGIATDTIRLGPVRYDLPPDASYVTAAVRWESRSANSSLWDFYSLLVTVGNNVTAASILPYGIDVTIPLPDAGISWWYPTNPYFAADQQRVTADDGTPLVLPAGEIIGYLNPANVGQGTSTIGWQVRGESKYGSVRVMDRTAQFYLLGVVLPKGDVLRSNLTVTLTWDYRSSIQTYPVASRMAIVAFIMRSAQAST